jgi:hypothetical protein
MPLASRFSQLERSGDAVVIRFKRFNFLTNPPGFRCDARLGDCSARRLVAIITDAIAAIRDAIRDSRIPIFANELV